MIFLLFLSLLASGHQLIIPNVNNLISDDNSQQTHKNVHTTDTHTHTQAVIDQ